MKPGPRTVLALLAAAAAVWSAPALAAEPAPAGHEHGTPAAHDGHGAPAGAHDDHGAAGGAHDDRGVAGDTHDHGAPAEDAHGHGRVAATPVRRTRALVVAGFLALNAAIIAGAAAAGLRSPRPARSRA